MKNTKTIAAVFPMGVQKEEIQQWRQARLRPGEKESLNIMLREKKSTPPKPFLTNHTNIKNIPADHVHAATWPRPGQNLATISKRLGHDLAWNY